MSLSVLVAFAQRTASSILPDTKSPNPGYSTNSGPGQSQLVDEVVRPGVPVWVRQRTSQQELPYDADHPWKIEGPADLQQEPPDVSTAGADALAFYAPFHFYKKEWGIYIRTSGVAYLAEVLKGRRLLPGDESYLELAEAILLEHEWHHAAAEIASTRAELTARTPLYRPYFACVPAAHLEEALANAQAISWVFRDGDPLGVRSKLEAWMSRQGPGYRDYRSRLSARTFSEGLDRAARFMVEHLPGSGPRADSSLHTFLFRGARRYRSMPCVRINDLGGSGATILRPFPKAHGIQVLVHSNEHPPPHIHILSLSTAEETRYLWPELIPLEHDKPLPGREKKGLTKYVETYRTQIQDKVFAVYGR